MARSPDPDEAAAIAAAIERFVAETSSGAAPDPAAGSSWQRVALIEGVSAKGSPLDDPRGGSQWLS